MQNCFRPCYIKAACHPLTPSDMVLWMIRYNFLPGSLAKYYSYSVGSFGLVRTTWFIPKSQLCVMLHHSNPQANDLINDKVIRYVLESIITSLDPFWYIISEISGLAAPRNAVAWTTCCAMPDAGRCLGSTQLALKISSTVFWWLPNTHWHTEPWSCHITLPAS